MYGIYEVLIFVSISLYIMIYSKLLSNFDIELYSPSNKMLLTLDYCY